MKDLFSPFHLGDLTLANRLVMAPMTRNRADEQGVPTDVMATYYGQRAAAGLVISESAPISRQAVGYLHVLQGDMMTRTSNMDYGDLRRRFGGAYIANNGYDKNSAQAAVRTGHADLVAFGTPFLANPDLVDRFKRDLPLNIPDHETFYGGGQRGYIDYPAIDAFAEGAKS